MTRDNERVKRITSSSGCRHNYAHINVSQTAVAYMLWSDANPCHPAADTVRIWQISKMVPACMTLE